MQWTTWSEARRRTSTRAVIGCVLRAVLAMSALAGGAAHAGLGDAKATTTADRAAISAETMTTRSMPAYDRTELTTVDGTSIREFSARDGTVFAVDFAGPTMPDLKAVLGSRYDSYVAAAKARRGSHHVVSSITDDAVITIVKLPRGFSGHAHLPAAVRGRRRPDAALTIVRTPINRWQTSSGRCRAPADTAGQSRIR